MSPPPPPKPARENISCFPTDLVARVGASVGDSWTLAGDTRLQGKIPGPPNELRDRSAESSVTFTLTGLDDGGMNRVVDEATGKRARIENSMAYAHAKTVYRDDERNILEGTDWDEDLYNEALAAGFGTETIAIHGHDRQALLTPDWDCHRNAWLTGGQPSSGSTTREYSVGERTLSSGRDVVLFTKAVTFDEPEAGAEGVSRDVYGYDKVTGRLVLTERYQSGTFDGQPYTLDMVREWVPALNLSGISVAPPALAPAVTGMIAPDLRLTFEGVEYTGVEILSAASPTGPVMCCGTPINMDDMEVVGTGTNHNPDGDVSVEVYRPKADATTDLYTFHPAQTVEASGEPGGTATGPATWTRWTAGFAPPAPAATSGTALTEDSFKGLMTIKDVETLLTSKVTLKADFRELRDMAEGVNPAQVEKMDSWYQMTIDAVDGGKGMTFSVIDFDSTSSAQDHFEKMKSETPGMQDMDSPIGDASIEIDVNAQGIGSMLVFIRGDKLVSLHTAQPEGQRPLLSLESLKDLADLVASRL